MENIINYLKENKGAATYSAAKKLNVPERDILKAIPEEASYAPVDAFDDIVETVSGWGDIMMIVTNGSVIFEVKGTLPKGKHSHGFFNLHEKGNPVGGHLIADKFDGIYFVSRPFMGKESHSIQIYDQQGDAGIKFYLGRDEKGEIKPEQREKFMELKKRYAECGS
ncbi:protein of unknown function DUF1008 [Denitrovibrio acetiphilus DSM 12809]|uniref:Heme utilization protein HuvX n=1 Tax=Denitrovibrio acetiphilus (strain DSM 12809 / NBRC 114555 / N2460) TaxID=522772 RepID=D4H5I2_DENA2|nr:heme utilization cystosolic carrier protein HutX [Denitrovibrio acetiphilus]ADD67602.1 protein of unknown function DUF1008 [Denitrovibrio acetiphilus DSM 12809]